MVQVTPNRVVELQILAELYIDSLSVWWDNKTPPRCLPQITHIRTFQDTVRRYDSVHGPIVLVDRHCASGKKLLIEAQRH